MNVITQEQFSDEGGWLVDVRMPCKQWQRLVKQNGKEIEDFVVSD
jgi:GTP-binding protein HflX